jgi:hypothetical protein
MQTSKKIKGFEQSNGDLLQLEGDMPRIYYGDRLADAFMDR